MFEKFSWLDVLFPWRLLRVKSKRCVVLFLGPKQHGKSELFAALKGMPVDGSRYNTGFAVNPELVECGELKFAVVDYDGDRKGLPNLCEKSYRHIVQKRPRLVLLVLVVDVQECHFDARVMSEELGKYIAVLKRACEGMSEFFRGWMLQKDIRDFITGGYDNSRWHFVVVGTHSKNTEEARKAVCRTSELLIENDYAGKIRNALPREGISFELVGEEGVDRKKVAPFMVRVIRKMLEGQR